MLVVMLLSLPAIAAWGQSGATATVRPVGQATSALVIVDGKLVEVESAELQRGRQVMIALRDLEKLGWGTVSSTTPDKFNFKANGVTLTFTKGKDAAMINSLAVVLPIDTYVRDGKLMVPLSFVAKSLNYQYDMAEKPVATISTTPPKPTELTLNTLQGTVLYDGVGVDGITVRAVNPDYVVVKNGTTRTDVNGEYKFTDLPDGTYRAYVYIGDNPVYFNGASDPVDAKGGGVFQLQPVSLVRVIRPIKPKASAQVALPAKGSLDFAWTACEGTQSYTLIIKKKDSDKALAETAVEKPEAKVPASLFTKGSSYEVEVRAANVLGEPIGLTSGPGGKAWEFSVKK